MRCENSPEKLYISVMNNSFACVLLISGTNYTPNSFTEDTIAPHHFPKRFLILLDTIQDSRPLS